MATLRQFAYLGDDDSSTYGPYYKAWADAVKKRGGTVTVYPNSSNARYASGAPPKVMRAGSPRPAGYEVGDLAEAYVINGVRVFVPPPTAVTNAYRAEQVAAGHAIAAGKRVEAIENGISTVLTLPKKVVDATFGLPPWLIPVAIGIGGILLISSLSSFIPLPRRSR